MTHATTSPARHSLKDIGARVAYAALFVVVLPIALTLWAGRMDVLLALAAPRSVPLGIVSATAGALLAVWATVTLWRDGGGLPASPFPPQRFVSTGPYRLVAHPIYVGTVAISAGVALATGSGGGLWIVTPVLAASAAAWVIGFERAATIRRFGSRPAPAVQPSGDIEDAARGGVWGLLRAGAEWVANSWREWTVGPVRLLSHGIYGGVGAALGVGIAVALAGEARLPWLLALTAAAIVGAGLWAQLVEGSPQLLRPYGYFGAVSGVILVLLVAGVAGADAWLLAGSFCLGSTVTYAAGRMRCLVQGCCHGSPTTARLGIVYRHPRSRVVRLAGLGGVPVHATPLYSALWMLLVGAALWLLWVLAAPLPVVVGAYFLLTGLGRFVEEHFRGEPQTMVLGGMRLYQWLAIAFVVLGAAISCVRGPSAPVASGLRLATIPVLVALAILVFGAYGVDFPRSNRRFARLV